VFGEAGGAGETVEAADEDGGGVIHGAGDDVEHPVEAVAEVNVEVAGLPEHDFGARGAAFGGVAGFVVGTVVGFHFRDAEADLGSVRESAHEGFAQEVTGDFEGWAVEEGGWEDGGHTCILAWGLV